MPCRMTTGVFTQNERFLKHSSACRCNLHLFSPSLNFKVNVAISCPPELNAIWSCNHIVSVFQLPYIIIPALYSIGTDR